MKKILQKIESTFDTHTKGYSARKLTAFVFVVLAVILAIKYTTPDNLSDVLIIVLTFVAFCLGLVTAQNIINLKNGTNTNNTSDSNELQGDKDKAE